MGQLMLLFQVILYFWWSYPIAAVAADENLETWKHLELR
jgi:hypothetical protein